MSQKELGYLLGVRPQSLGELLAKLERAGLVVRSVDSADRRSQVVDLTDAGRTAAEQAGRPGDEDDPFVVLTEEQRAQLAALLDTVVEALHAEVGGPHGRGPGGYGPGGYGPGGDGPGGDGPGDLGPEGGPFGPGGPRGFGPGRGFGREFGPGRGRGPRERGEDRPGDRLELGWQRRRAAAWGC